MARFILRAAFAGVGLWLAAQLLDGVSFSNWGSLVAAALLLGIVNAIVRPLVILLTLPFTIVTLGLFLLVVNAAMIGLVAMLLRGFSVDGLGPGILAAVVTGLVSMVGHMALKDDRR